MESQPVPDSQSRAFFSKLKHPSQFSKRQLTLFILTFGLVGLLIWRSFAAAPVVATLQAEQMTPSGANSSSGFTTSLTNGMSIAAPYIWNFNPGVATSAGYFFADGKQLAKITGPGPYAFRLSSGLLSSGSHMLGHAWDTTGGLHLTPPSAYSATISNTGNTGFVTSLTSGTTINPPYVWAFDPGVATSAGYFFADGKQLAKITGPGPYVYTLASGALSTGSHRLGHAWDTTSGSHQTPRTSYKVTVGTAASTNYSVINDSTASGGQAAKFGSGVSLSGSAFLSAASTSLTVTAHGEQCSGSWPQMSLAVDGNNVINTTVSSTSWTSYSTNLSLTAGTHTLTITNTSSGSCAPNLYADVTNFFGTSAPPAVPTVALSASPSSVSSGQSSTLTWNSTNANTCTASGAWSGSEPLSGSVSTGAINQSSTYSLTCTGSGGTATASAAVTVTSSTSSYDQAISYTQTRAPFTPTRTVNVSSVSALLSAISSLQAGDYVKATAPFTVTGETIINKRLTAPAVLDLAGVSFVYSAGSNLPAVWVSNAQNIRIYGGNLSTADTGGNCMLVYGSQYVTWWGFYAHDCGTGGIGVMPVNAASDHLDFQGEITKVGQHIAWDSHCPSNGGLECGTGIHAALWDDVSNSNAFTNNRFALYAHDIPTGACLQIGNPQAVSAEGGNVLYLKCVNETEVAKIQTGGNALQFWGDTNTLGLDIKYLEGDNLQGYALWTGGVYSGQNLNGVTVEYGRATNTNLNSLFAGKNPWDATKGVVYHNVLPAPIAGKP